MSTPSTKSWSSCQLIRKAWGDEILVFNTASGNTHLVNRLAAKVLEFIDAGAITSIAIADRLAAEAGVSPDKELIESVESVLASLDDLGLVQPQRQ